MPSKKNKRIAAAQRSGNKSAAIAVEQPNDSPPAEEFDEYAACRRIAPATALAVSSVLTSPSDSPTPSLSPQIKEVPAQESDFSLENLPKLGVPNKLTPLRVGNPVDVQSNAFAISLIKKLVHRYDTIVEKRSTKNPGKTMTGTKGGDRKRQTDCTAIVEIAFQRAGHEKHPYVYDGASTIYMVKPISKTDHSTNAIHVTIESGSLPERLRKAHFPKGPGTFTVNISPNRKPTILTDFIYSETLENMESGDKSVTSLLQIAMSHEAKKKGFMVQEGGNELFHPNARKTNRSGVEEREGVGASVKLAAGRDGKGQVLVVVHHKIANFFAEGPVANLPVNFRERPSKFMRGIKIGTTYSTQTFSFESFSDQPIGQLRIRGQPLLDVCASIAKVPVRTFNPDLPAFTKSYRDNETKERKSFYFPIESLRVLGAQKLGPNQGEPPRCSQPHTRYQQTLTIGDDAHILSSNPTLADFGVHVDATPLSLRAIQVPTPSAVYRGGIEMRPQLDRKATWNMSRAQFFSPATHPKVILAYHSGSDGPLAGAIVLAMRVKLIEQSNSLGMKIDSWIVEDLADTYPGSTNVEAIAKKLSSLTQNPRPYVMYFDDPSHPTHDILKLNERRYQVLTQQVAFGKAARMNPGNQTVNNLLLKMNIKLGGLNHLVRGVPEISRFWGPTSDTLIISYDVCHSSGSGAGDEPSVVGFAFNTHKNPELVIGDFHIQRARQEQVDGAILETRAFKIMETYHRSRGKIPQNVLVLRDGVSEGQYRMVKHREVVAIERGVSKYLTSRGDTRRPKFAVIIATKRHANRLYTKINGHVDNVPPLIAVDHTIVRKQANEILFVSHCPLNGTAQPLLLNILRNDGVFRSNDEVVNLMAALCMAHQHSTNIISLPETIYAADEYAKRGADLFASFRIGMQAEGHPMPRLDDGALDLEKITKLICYETSGLCHRRMV